ncbi:MAG: VWA domain-containing protein, partial [Spirochaetota bacterium]
YILLLLPCALLLPLYYRRQLEVFHLLCRHNLSGEMRVFYRRYFFLLAFFAILFVLSIFLALAKPLWGYNSKVGPQVKNLQIVFVLDISRSMLARDVAPSRLKRAVGLLGELYEIFQDDELGLVVFKGRPQTLIPLSRDRLVFPSLFPQLDSEILQTPGSNIAAAVTEGIKLFDNKSNASQIIILLSDGESLSGEPDHVRDRLDNWDGTLISIGVGTKEGAELFHEDGNLITDYYGLPIHSRLQDAFLKDLSRRTLGKYYRIQELNLAQKLQNELAPLTRGERILEYNLQARYQIFVCVALLSFLGFALLKRFGFMGFYQFIQSRKSGKKNLRGPKVRFNKLTKIRFVKTRGNHGGGQ